MEIIPFIYKDINDFCANTYVLVDSKKRCVVIDPSRDNNGIIDFIHKNRYKLKAVLLTHSHYDHMRGADRLIKKYKCPFYVGYEDIRGLQDAEINCSSYSKFEPPMVVNSKATAIYQDDVINVLDEPIKVISTPYHTIGSVSFFLEKSNVVFSGDSLFWRAVGRTDLSTSDRSLMKDSLMKLFALPEEAKVYPGHGRFTTIKDEKVLL